MTEGMKPSIYFVSLQPRVGNINFPDIRLGMVFSMS